MFEVGTVLGHEYAGEVVAVGRDVDGIGVGDNVTVLPMTGCGVCAACVAGEPLWCSACRYMIGGFGEYVLADARYAVRLPSCLSPADGALGEPLASALQAVRLSGLDVGARVLVLGAGAIGLGVVYWLRRLGAGIIVATARSRRNEGIVHEMGVSGFIAQGERFDESVMKMFGGKPDIVFDCAGHPGVFSQAVDVVRPKGTVVGAAVCFHPENFVVGNANWKQLRIQFSSTSVPGFYPCSRYDVIWRPRASGHGQRHHKIGKFAVHIGRNSSRGGSTLQNHGRSFSLTNSIRVARRV